MQTDSSNYDVQIIGLIRFSYLCTGGFQTNYADSAEHITAVYADDRMQEHFAYFEQLCLPSLKNQTDQDFKLGILIGDSMPEEYQERLRALVADVSQVEIIILPVMAHRTAMHEATSILDDRSKPYRIMFRLDDDDAVARNYIARLRGFIPALMAFSETVKPVAISFFRGVMVNKSSEKSEILPYLASVPTSVGTAIFSKSGWQRSVYDFPHQKILTRLRFLCDNDQFMFLRSIHNSNDSYGKLNGYLLPTPLEDHTEEIESQFGMTLDNLLRLGHHQNDG